MGKIARVEIQGHLEALARVAGLKIAVDEKDAGLHLDYLAPNGWQVVEQTSSNAVFGYGRLRGPEMIQNLNFAKRVIEYCQGGSGISIGLKPASMFDAQVHAAVRRVLNECEGYNVPKRLISVEDARLLRVWVGK